jgi:hypothetical protein
MMGDLPILEQGTIVKAHKSCLTVEVDGVELHVSPQVERRSCTCCGDTTELRVSYNRKTEDRIEDHGEADPLDIQ